MDIEAAKPAENGAEAQPLPSAGVSISFHGIRFTVKDRATRAPLDILRGVSGTVLANRLTVIMGSSGAGKTTLLDVLACNVFGGGVVGGTVLVNGQPRDPASFSQISCYVLQRDVLMPSATVREALTVSALLKLPRAMPPGDKLGRVDAILAELDLEGCQHTLIGDEVAGIKGISGGQRRRVSVGIELVKQPRVLFLDEPTSGLDSEMAVSLIDTLVQLARQNRTVCTTIHQPNSLITSKFDDFMLLHAGSCVYAGPWEGAVPHFAAQGCPCPQYLNPTDYFLSVMKDRGDGLALTWAKQEQQSRHCTEDTEAPGDSSTAAAGEAAAAAQRGLGRLKAALGLGSPVSASPSTASSALQPEPSVAWWYQVAVLSSRMFKQWIRNPAMLISEVVQYGFMALFVGLVWLQVNHSLGTGVNDRAASLWFAMAILSFTPGYTAVVVWEKDRLLLRRETQQGMYSVTAWFTARTLTLLPFELAQCLLFCVVMYWMVGYYASFVNWLIFTLAFIMFQLISEAIGEMCAIVGQTATYAVLVLTFVLLFLLSFSGFLVYSVPVYFRWISKISYLTYAYSAVMANEFNQVTFYSSGGLAVPGSWLLDPASAPPDTPPQVQEALALSPVASAGDGLSIGANMAVLAGITVGTRLLAFAFIYILAKLKRL